MTDLTPEFEAACNGEIDLIPASEMGDDLIAELDLWAEIGWVLLECGCLANANGRQLHQGHVEPEPDPLDELTRLSQEMGLYDELH